MRTSRHTLWNRSAKARENGWQLQKTDFPESIEGSFYPRENDLFRSLEMTSPQDVRAVIVGQDPYFSTSGDHPDATGLAFAVREDHPAPPASLLRIKRMVYGNKPGRNDLADWVVEKNVLLLNAALTVPAFGDRSAAGKHLKLKIWDDFLAAVLRQVRPDTPIVAWGDKAKVALGRSLALDWEQPPPHVTWCYHPVASKTGRDSFSSFWRTPLGQSLTMNS